MISTCLETSLESGLRIPIIVGSGPVGISLARSLSMRGIKCLVLEGGGSTTNSDVKSDLGVSVSGSAFKGHLDARTRQIGGGVNLWGGQLALPHKSESGATGEAQEGWPISLDEVRGRGYAASGLLGQKIDIQIETSTPGLQRAKQGLAAFGLDLVSTAWLKAPKLPTALWCELKSSPNIRICHDVCVVGLEADESGGVTGVRCRTNTGIEKLIHGAPVILCCGTIEMVRLLLQPVGGKKAPWADLDWLGRGFNDHLDAAVATVTPNQAGLLLDVFDPAVIGGARYSCKAFLQAKVAGGGDDRALSAVGMLTLPGNIRNSLAELRMLINSLSPRSPAATWSDLARAIASASRESLPLAFRYLKHKRIATVIRGESTLRVSLEQPVRRQSRITLAEERDRWGVRRANVHWLRGQEEGELFLAAAQKLKRWAENTGAAQINIAPKLLSDPREFAQEADEGLHHAGGVRMASNSRDGVVDTNLAVFGTRNLYCCGAATFPRMGYANPTLTAVALADRLAEHIAKQER